MRVLVTGAGGQLGSAVCRELEHRCAEAFGFDRCSMDITDKETVRRRIFDCSPDAVIHCAAWTAVDAAEVAENLQKVRTVNAEGTRNVAEACKVLGCKMMYISTDYVFDGRGTDPWEPDCRGFGPLNVYGQTKLEGELAVQELLEKYFIVRTSWVFAPRGQNFVGTMLRLAESHGILRVVNDQIGTPTYVPDLARLLCDMVETEKYGVYHATNEGGYLSWCDFAREIFRQAGRDNKVIPVTTAEYGLAKAARPLNSRLDKSKLDEMGFARLPDWRDALGRYITEQNKVGDCVRGERQYRGKECC